MKTIVNAAHLVSNNESAKKYADRVLDAVGEEKGQLTKFGIKALISMINIFGIDESTISGMKNVAEYQESAYKIGEKLHPNSTVDRSMYNVQHTMIKLR